MNNPKILFIHQAFPGQFGNLALYLAKKGYEVTAIGLSESQNTLQGVRQMSYKLPRLSNPNVSPLVRDLETKLLRAEGITMQLYELKAEGYRPDVVYAHPGWGEALFVKQVWPDTRLAVYAEWFYNSTGQEMGFDPEFDTTDSHTHMKLQMKNTVFLHALKDADILITPTSWQKSRFPYWAQEKINVIHDGIDLNRISLLPPRKMLVQDKNKEIKPGDPVVTFVSRFLEPVRGFHIFMRALPKVLKENPNAEIFILGQDTGNMPGTGYGQPNKDGFTWRQSLLNELGDSIDTERVHFLGFIPYEAYISVLRLSACHVYLTIPFILSWSFLEAAFIGMPIIASDTEPLKEFNYLRNIHLVNFFDHNALSKQIINTLKKPISHMPNDFSNLDINVTLPKIESLLFEGLKISVSQKTIVVEEEKNEEINKEIKKPDVTKTDTKKKTKKPIKKLNKKAK